MFNVKKRQFYLSGNTGIWNSGVVVGRKIVVSPARSVRCRVGTSLAQMRLMRGSADP
jgi:hypothetical protein